MMFDLIIAILMAVTGASFINNLIDNVKDFKYILVLFLLFVTLGYIIELRIQNKTLTYKLSQEIDCGY